MVAKFDFEAWIRSRPERCSKCGYHPKDQGHADNCPLKGMKR